MTRSQVFGAFLILLLTTSLSEGLFISESFAQWMPQTSGTIEQLNDVVVIDGTTAIAVGNNGTILKTTNLGATWIPKSIGTTANLRSTAFYGSRGYAVGDSIVCFSTDKGETWSIESSPHNFTVVEFGAHINQSLYMGAESGFIRHKITLNSTWQERMLQGGSIVSIGLRYGALQSTNAYAATFDYVYHTFEGGPPVWDSVVIQRLFWDTPTGGDLRNHVQYIVGWGGNPGPLPYLLRRASTSDTTWQRFSLPAPFFPTDIKTSRNGAIVYVCGSKRTIYQSVDSGATWTLQYGNTGNYFPALRAMAFRNDTIGYAVGDSGTILFTSNGGVTFIDEEPNMPYTFVLQQNYPNPFNPSTTIEFSLPVRSRGILKIFNILGEEIEVLVNGELEAGEHLINWEAKNLPSGIYFYRLITDNFNITRKMVLLR